MRSLPEGGPMPLMPLPFGNKIAKRYIGLTQASDAISEILPGLARLDAADTQPFRAKMAMGQFGDLKLMANSQDACRMHVEETGGWHLVVPVAGSASLECDNHKFSLIPGRSSLLLPNIERIGERTDSSVAVFSFQMPKLNRVLATMTGEEESQHIPDQRPLAIHTDPRSGLFPAFLTICKQIDLALMHPDLGNVLDIEDIIYRWMAATVSPMDGDARLPVRSRRCLDVVCDLAGSLCERPLTLTEMEMASGLSARALQYAFKARFGCSPMAWQRRERMLKARQLLLANADSQTITTLAYDMGFHRLPPSARFTNFTSVKRRARRSIGQNDSGAAAYTAFARFEIFTWQLAGAPQGDLGALTLTV
jgi:AraC-like DNA-binding protein